MTSSKALAYPSQSFEFLGTKTFPFKYMPGGLILDVGAVESYGLLLFEFNFGNYKIMKLSKSPWTNTGTLYIHYTLHYITLCMYMYMYMYM